MNIKRLNSTPCQLTSHVAHCVWVVERGKKRRGGLLTWLEWLFCSCAIVYGGVLRAALQQHRAFDTWKKATSEVLLAVT